jgi:hypothetical protein
MVLLIVLLTWVALCAAAVFFVYCCSRVSNGPTREFMDDDFPAPEPDLIGDQCESAQLQTD